MKTQPNNDLINPSAFANLSKFYPKQDRCFAYRYNDPYYGVCYLFKVGEGENGEQLLSDGHGFNTAVKKEVKLINIPVDLVNCHGFKAIDVINNYNKLIK